jgi:hypothetical protein
MILKWSACGLEGREPRTEGREELDLLIGYFEGGTTPYRSDSHLPGTFRGGMVARLQRLSKQHEDRTFTP